MGRSKLELLLDIITVLRHRQLLYPSQIMHEVNVSYSFLKGYLDFLVKQNLVEKKISDGHRTKYAVTQKGLDVLRNYEELEKALRIEDKRIFLIASAARLQAREST